MSAHRPLVVYDGDCGICTATVAWLRRRGADEVLRFAASLDRPSEMLAVGLTLQDCMEAAYVIESASDRSEGFRTYRGAAAINFAVGKLPGGRNTFFRLMASLYHLPGLRYLQNLGYAWVARNRHRLRAGPQVCSVPRPKDQA